MKVFIKSDLPAFLQIDHSLLQRVRKLTGKYIDSFTDRNDPDTHQHITLKQEHIQNVCTEIRNLGITLGMNDNELAFAETIALLHDIGRFRQFKVYRTFSDADSEDHSEIALHVIDKKGLLEGFDADKRTIVEKSVLNHNRPSVPEGEDIFVDFYSRMLRDADKTDIWRVVMKTNIFHRLESVSQPDTYKIPERLLSYFGEQKPIPLNLVFSLYDSILFRLSWVFDLNFRYSAIQVLERNIIPGLISKIPYSAPLGFISKQVTGYVESIRNSVSPEP